MATGSIILPMPGQFDATNPPGLVFEHSIPHALFDDTVAEIMRWRFRIPQDFASALVLKLIYSMVSATSGTIEFEAAIWASSDGDDADNESYDTVNTATETVPGTAGFASTLSVTMANIDAMDANDLCALRIARDADDGTNDTATGDLELRAVSLEYTTG